MSNNDLARHASEKVSRALDDVMQLTDDPFEMLKIALLASNPPLGAAAGILCGIMSRHGAEISQAEAFEHLLDLLKMLLIDGVEATLAALRKEASGG